MPPWISSSPFCTMDLNVSLCLQQELHGMEDVHLPNEGREARETCGLYINAYTYGDIADIISHDLRYIYIYIYIDIHYIYVYVHIDTYIYTSSPQAFTACCASCFSLQGPSSSLAFCATLARSSSRPSSAEPGSVLVDSM